MAAENHAAKAFAEEYAEKIFYFCLKKTGDSREAEDLASDIALSVVHALTHGPAPRHPWTPWPSRTKTPTPRPGCCGRRKRGFCGRWPDGSAYVNAFVFLPGVLPKILDFCDTLPLFAALKSDMAENVRQVRKTVAAAAHKRLREHVDYYAGMAAATRRATMARAWKDQGFYTGEQGQFCAFFLGK